MSRLYGAHELGFDESIRAFLLKVECRAPVGDSEKEQIYRLRYRAYAREGALPPGAPEIFKDAMDEAANARTFGFYVDGKLASSIRLHIATPENPVCPAMAVFSDYLRPVFDSRMSVIDPTRFVADAAFARLYPKLPYVTVRVAFMACDYFVTNLLLATVRTEHQAFYRRLFGHRVACDARPYPSLSKPISLMVLDFPAERERIKFRYPFLRSTESERQAIFGRAFGLQGGRAAAQGAKGEVAKFDLSVNHR